MTVDLLHDQVLREVAKGTGAAFPFEKAQSGLSDGVTNNESLNLLRPQFLNRIDGQSSWPVVALTIFAVCTATALAMAVTEARESYAQSEYATERVNALGSAVQDVQSLKQIVADVQAEQRRQQDALRKQAETDQLTGATEQQAMADLRQSITQIDKRLDRATDEFENRNQNVGLRLNKLEENSASLDYATYGLPAGASANNSPYRLTRADGEIAAIDSPAHFRSVLAGEYPSKSSARRGRTRGAERRQAAARP